MDHYIGTFFAQLWKVSRWNDLPFLLYLKIIEVDTDSSETSSVVEEQSTVQDVHAPTNVIAKKTPETSEQPVVNTRSTRNSKQNEPIASTSKQAYENTRKSILEKTKRTTEQPDKSAQEKAVRSAPKPTEPVPSTSKQPEIVRSPVERLRSHTNTSANTNKNTDTASTNQLEIQRNLQNRKVILNSIHLISDANMWFQNNKNGLNLYLQNDLNKDTVTAKDNPNASAQSNDELPRERHVQRSLTSYFKTRSLQKRPSDGPMPKIPKRQRTASIAPASKDVDEVVVAEIENVAQHEVTSTNEVDNQRKSPEQPAQKVRG